MKHTKCYIPEYPRPQLVRPDWENLCGQWQFAFGEEVTKEQALKGQLTRTIRVPFAYQSKASGIGLEEHREVVWYARTLPRRTGRRTLLHFEGADQDTQVYLNGQLVGSHRGAYSRFSFDITEFLTEAENLLVVRCEDSEHPIQVRGKQRWECFNFGCWYVQTTGLYKPVWLEYVEDIHLTQLKITPDPKNISVRFDFSVSRPSPEVEVDFRISFGGKPICSLRASAWDVENTASVKLRSKQITYQAERWSIGNPALYDVDITVYHKNVPCDRLGSYFGLRDFVAKDGKLLLNEMPFYARLLLDQGYWPESGLTPPSEEAMIQDIQLTKAMGYNGVRKHQKIEDERFFYYADILGLCVWCELPSNHWNSDGAACDITRQWLDIVRQNYSHPSLLTWVIFNESWGVPGIASDPAQQNLATGLYYLTKSIDPMRPVISNDGWRHTKSDILTLHHYEQDGKRLYSFFDTLEKLTQGDPEGGHCLPYAEGFRYEGQPIIMSEFGGTAYVQQTENGSWGYGFAVSSDEEYIQRMTSLVTAVRDMRISGYCYTQITDVEQEVNGVLRPDRTPKIPIEVLRKINSL